MAITFWSNTRIRLDSIYELLEALRKEYKLRFHTVSFDQYQSASYRQRAEERSLAANCNLLSVDRTSDHYFALANLIAQDRFKIGDCSAKLDLIEQLQSITVDEDNRIVKPYLDKKNHCDLADAVVGAVANAAMNTRDVPVVVYLADGLSEVENKEELINATLKKLKLSW